VIKWRGESKNHLREQGRFNFSRSVPVKKGRGGFEKREGSGSTTMLFISLQFREKEMKKLASDIFRKSGRAPGKRKEGQITRRCKVQIRRLEVYIKSSASKDINKFYAASSEILSGEELRGKSGRKGRFIGLLMGNFPGKLRPIRHERRLAQKI